MSDAESFGWLVLIALVMLAFKFRKALGALLGVGLTLAVPVFVFYLFIRFVKWAWTD